ncbi:unnamed protein product [Cylicocyclus nassatus]|uniref:Uncharacterized protein n=1 Tax=Cylicocyclus nassatus TaxID=53992 RepID=A0AA36DLY6_CYLNA|nr:unnamed protein product [Cylicocyclus nassatus]
MKDTPPDGREKAEEEDVTVVDCDSDDEMEMQEKEKPKSDEKQLPRFSVTNILSPLNNLARVQQQLLKMTSSPLNEHSLAFGYRPGGGLPASYFVTKKLPISAYDGEKTNETSEGDIFDECPFHLPDPWHKSVLKYVDVKHGYKAACAINETSKPVTQLVNGSIKLLPGKENFTCTARCLTYGNDKSYTAGNWSDIEGQVFDCDFVETKCELGDSLNRFLHMQIAEQKLPTKSSKMERSIHPDVHIIVIDSVASTQIIRALPRTVNFLLHGMDAVEFPKLNKVGSNSRPNMFPLLLGKTTEAVERTVMNIEKIEADLDGTTVCRKYLDNFPYIPFEYYEAGYKVLDAQDYTASVLIWPNCRGMKKKTAHHYYRPFHIRTRQDKELLRNHGSGRCRESYNNMLDYHSIFLRSYDNFPKFSYVSLTELTHDNSAQLYEADYDLYEYLLRNRDALNSSFLFFLSDHGPRFGGETKASVNRNEQKNPFLYIVLPERLRGSPMHEQLKTNSKELLTHHDIHSTLQDILYFQPATNFTEMDYKDFNNSKRGSSLLRRFEAGIKRNCKTLPIPFQYCICQYATSAVTDEKLRQKLAIFAVEQLDLLLQSEGVSSSCENVKLKKILSINQYTSTSMFENQIFDVTFEVAPPARGKFQIPVRLKQGKLALAGATFLRLDRYNDMGDCMSKGVLRSYCTCKNRVH